MNELVKIISEFDGEKKKKMFFDLSNAKSVEGIIDVGNNYNLNITNEQAIEMFNGLKGANNLSKEELTKMAGGMIMEFDVLDDCSNMCFIWE